MPPIRARPSGAATSSPPIETVSPSNDNGLSNVVISSRDPRGETAPGRPSTGGRRAGVRATLQSEGQPALSSSTPAGIGVPNGEAA